MGLVAGSGSVPGFRPAQIALDASGNVYIADIANSRIHRVAAGSGAITTVAGGGTGGDGGLAVNAALNAPCGVAVDGQGNLYITETCTAAAAGGGGGGGGTPPPGGTGRLRKVTAATGVISTIAGNASWAPLGDNGPANLAGLGLLGEVALDGAGNIYLADASNGRIRRIDAATQTITTVVGGGASFADGVPGIFTSLNGPWGVTVDAAGNLYVAEMNSHRIRKWTASTGLVTTIAGTGTAGYNGDGRLATATQINMPISVSVDNAGNVYFSEYAPGGRIRRINAATGRISTVFTMFNGQIGMQWNRISNLVWAPDQRILVSELSSVTSVTLGNGTPTTTTLSVAPAAPTTSQAVTFTATVSPSTATGTVYFYNAASGFPQASATVTNGVATWTLANGFFPGDVTMFAVYAGSAAANASTSAAQTLAIRNATTLSISSNLNPAPVGQPVGFTANFSTAGMVDFMDGNTLMGSMYVMGPTTFTTSTLTPGAHNITAVYAGDSSNAPVTSAVLVQTIQAASATTLAANPVSANSGAPVTLTATVTPVTATGAVQFLDGATVIGSAAVSGGTATLVTTTLAPGARSLTARYQGDAALGASTSSAVTVTVKAVAAVVLTINPNPVTMGQTMTMTATVTPATATGTVNFVNTSGVTLGTATLTNGVATATTTSQAFGGNTLFANYGGDAQTTAAESAGVAYTVRGATTTTLSIPQTLVGPNAPTLIRALLANSQGVAVNDGTVEFFDNGLSLGTAPVSGGVSQINPSFTTLGEHPITATYSGASVHAGSTTAAPTSVFVKTYPTVSIASGQNPSNSGQNVTFTCSVQNVTAGSVRFLEDATLLATVAVTNGTASYTTSSLGVGLRPVYCRFVENNEYLESAASVIQVVKALATVTLAASVNPSAPGQNVTFTATLTPSASTPMPPSGTVNFVIDGVAYPASLSNNVATYSTAALAPGAHTVRADYAGDQYVSSGSSSVLAQVVKFNTSVAVASSANPSAFGQAVTLTASVLPNTATGTVQFLDGGTVIGTGTLAGGTAALTVSNLAVGAHSITVVYAGSGTHMGSTSAALGQNVNKANTAAVVASSLNPSTAGQSVTFTIAVTPATATGTVQLRNGTTTLATLTLSGGVATYSTSSLAAGTRPITAVYAGDASFNGSTSPVLSQVVRTATSMTISSSRNPSRTTQSVTFTARITPSTTGSVRFFDGTTLIGTASLSSGRATLTLPTMTVGSHPIRADFVGSTTHAPSSSPVLTQTVTN